MSETPKLLLEKDGPLGWIVFDEPDKRNAVGQEIWQLVPEYVADRAAGCCRQEPPECGAGHRDVR